MKNKDEAISGILKKLWEDGQRYKFRPGDIVKDTRRGTIGTVLGFKPLGMSEDNLFRQITQRINFDASGTGGTLLGNSFYVIIQTLEQTEGSSIFEYRIRYVSEKYLKPIELRARYNEGLVSVKEHCDKECILECSPECSLYKYR